jgi:hypothetical protein
LAVTAAILLTLTCSSSESFPCDDVAAVDTVFYESGVAVMDSVGARLVFEEYVAHVKASGELFPDGAEDWLLDRVSPSPWDVAPWIVFYFPQPGGPFNSEVYVDRDGRVVRLVIAVHAPCAPLLGWQRAIAPRGSFITNLPSPSTHVRQHASPRATLPPRQWTKKDPPVPLSGT